MQYTKIQINSNIRRALEDGRSNDDALDLYLKMNMENDLGPERPFIRKGPSPSDVHMNLIGNHVIDKNTYIMEIKSLDSLPLDLSRLLAKLKIYPRSFSKPKHAYLKSLERK